VKKALSILTQSGASVDVKSNRQGYDAAVNNAEKFFMREA
jgi:hypothetical protein